jgi:hypothetical protein
MKTILFALISLSLGHVFATPGLEVESIHTLQGKTYLRCKVVKRDPDGVAFTHQKGTARVLFSDLPESTRMELGYNASEAAALEKSRQQAKQDRQEEARQRQVRKDELRKELILAELKRSAQMPPVIFMSQPSPFTGPVPAVGFAASGWSTGPTVLPSPRFQGWDAVGIATIGVGSGGIYSPQSGGFLFTGLPQIHYSPTLGYYNPGGYGAPAAYNTFGVVPGLAAPAPPPVVPGAARAGSVAMPLSR